MDPSTMYLVPRPETKELDAAIAFVEQQLKELDVSLEIEYALPGHIFSIQY